MNPFERSICGNTRSFRNQHWRRPWLAVHVGFALWLLPLAQAQDPIITLQPTNQTAMAGVTVTVFMSVQATSSNGPMTYQWQRDDPAAPMTFTNIPNAIESRLSLRNVTLDDTGDYRAVVFNASGDSAFSDVAHLTVKAPDFTRITGPGSYGYGWSDYDRDGFLDLYLTTAWPSQSPGTSDALYRNLGDGTFERRPSPLSVAGVDTFSVFWIDFDNDGDQDLFISGSTSTESVSFLYRNDGDGRFTNLPFPHTDLRFAWGDYDNDGDLDVYVDRLLENDGAGGFIQRTGPGYPPVRTGGYWVDLDNDGGLELLVWQGAQSQDPPPVPPTVWRYNRESTEWIQVVSSVS